jgi:hypothetical protein
MKEIEASLWVHARKNPSNVEKLISKLLAKKKLKVLKSIGKQSPIKLENCSYIKDYPLMGHIFLKERQVKTHL